MLVLRQALAFPMYGAAVWLVWVVSQEAGADGVLAALSGALLIGFAAWLMGATQRQRKGARARPDGRAAAAIVAIALCSMSPRRRRRPQRRKARALTRKAAWRRCAPEGRPVFVDMTAAWCVTCLVNERIALSSEPVKQAFAGHKVAYLKGDWTHADPAISQFLREHGRDGVPLYVFYPPNGQPVVLPRSFDGKRRSRPDLIGREVESLSTRQGDDDEDISLRARARLRSASPPPGLPDALKIGQPAPVFTGTDSNGHAVKLRRSQGQGGRARMDQRRLPLCG